MFRSRSRTAAVAWIAGALLGGAALAASTLSVEAANATPTIHVANANTGLYVVPAGVTAVTVSLGGAHGNDPFCDRVAGRGGSVTATIAVAPGETLQYNVGDSYYGSASGNSSDIRRFPYALSDRLVVAGGGGYDSDYGGQDSLGNCKTTRTGPGLGGDGGAPTGRTGSGEAPGICGFQGGHGGVGGQLNGPGAGGTTCGVGGPGAPGTFGFGGSGGGSGSAVAPCSQGGAGGAGWWGGGGGGGTGGSVPTSPGGCTDALGNSSGKTIGGGGGGGSSYAEPSAKGVVYQVGVNDSYLGWVTVARAAAPAAPSTVASVSPRSGPMSGGQVVTILGTHLTGATAVKFGASAATHVVVVSATKITARTPAHAAGVVDVTVTVPTGTTAKVTADRYTYAKVPTVTSLGARRGSVKGGRSLVIRGTQFTGATSVLFGTRKGVHLVVVSSTKIVVRIPAHAAGTVDVRVTTPGGISRKVTADRFTYR